ncbi:MAG: hypothetical protein MI974_08990 [Chitinophagales bacterium]|nr:hypothetical protein [Chitinophagales bacterium]
MRYLITLSLLFFLLPFAEAQEIKKQEAKEYFLHQRYSDALAVLNSARTLVRSDNEAKFLKAICHYQVNELDQSRTIFKSLIQNDREAYPECWLYMGKIYHAMHQFEKAASHYKDYLRRIKNNHPNRAMVRDAISRCATGMRLQFKQSKVIVENMGGQVNTPSDEFAPVVSPNFGKKLYFSSIRSSNMGGARNNTGMPDNRLGKYYSDLYSCELSNTGWGDVKAMPYLINSPQHEVLLDFSANGSVLYYFKGWTKEKGQIYVDTFRRMEERHLSSDPFQGPLSSALGDGQPYFVNDELVYFASNRPGGYGGMDIYVAIKEDGRWGAPKNLGPTINTPYDETSPFLARDKRTLYFSTNNSQRSMGGLDIVKVVYNKQADRWTVPENVGTPINSAADDAYFRISKDGFTAYFSSARKDGYGQRDIYVAYFSSFLPEMELPLATYSPPPANEPAQLQQTTTQAVVDVAVAPQPYGTTTTEPVSTNDPPVVTNAQVQTTNLFDPVYLTNSNAPLSKEAYGQLLDIADYLKKYDDLQLIITAFSASDAAVGVSIFNGIKKAEEVADYLISKGVDPGAIFMRSAQVEKDKLSTGVMSLNYSFFKPEDFPEEITLPDLEVDLSSSVPQHELNKNLIYKVQVFSLGGASKSGMLTNYPNAMVEKMHGVKYYRYTLGAFQFFDEADAFRKKLAAKEARSAFVVPYIYGLRADKMMARRHIIHFPDLQNYAN